METKKHTTTHEGWEELTIAPKAVVLMYCFILKCKNKKPQFTAFLCYCFFKPMQKKERRGKEGK
jgi:hypothetical protein